MAIKGALLYPRELVTIVQHLPMTLSYSYVTVDAREAKPKVNTRENIRHRPGKQSVAVHFICVCVVSVSTYRIPSHKTVDYKYTAKAKLETRSNIKYTPTVRKQELYHNDVQKFRDVKCKVDSSDPAPYSHQMSHSLSELLDMRGLHLNPRFSKAIKSGANNSAEDIILYTLHHTIDIPDRSGHHTDHTEHTGHMHGVLQ